ncbi:hypothetical protein [Alicyclobacillus shizuokensis]|uniref:hypothetical protein n=1 Tax=Alicyclobacillus shizuokensis TaxID=392014 RepID=UPI0012EE0ED3|nr:hypothetical protein [Alicyclobacillus shizuokensis]
MLEVTMVIGLSAVLTTVGLFWLLSLGRQCGAGLDALASEAAWDNAARVLTQDGHASTQIRVAENALSLDLVSGDSYTYLVNAEGQLVRVGEGGGTSVLADGFASLECAPERYGFSVQVTMLDGQNHILHVRTIGDMMS